MKAQSSPATCTRHAIIFVVMCTVLQLSVRSSAQVAPPDHDDLANAREIQSELHSTFESNANATKEVGEPNHAGNVGGASVWWRYTAPASAQVEIFVDGDFDTLLAVYTGEVVDSLTPVASNDNAFTGQPLNGSMVRFAAVAGTTYVIAVDGNGGATGLFTFDLDLLVTSNDNFANALPIAGRLNVFTGENSSATREIGEPNHAGQVGGASVWFAWTPTTSGLAEMAVSTVAFDSLLAVYTGSSVGFLTEVASNDNRPPSTNSLVQFQATAGTTYRIAVDSKEIGTTIPRGVFNLEWILHDDNDAFMDALILAAESGSIAGNNSAATKEAGEPHHAGNPGGASVWWRWTAPATGIATFDTRQSAIDTLLAVYTGNSVDALTMVASDADGASRGFSEVTFLAESGTTYNIAVDGHNNGGGPQVGPINLNWELGEATPTLAIAAPQVLESAGDVNVIISLFPSAMANVTVSVSTRDGTATAGSDYVSRFTQVVFAPGITSQQVTVMILDDAIVEGNESFELFLSSAVNADIAGTGAAIVTILDDDVAQVSVSDATAAEGDSLTFTLSLSQPSPFQGSVAYATSDGTATAGLDYAATSGTAVFAPNQTTATVVVQSLDDDLDEGDESFILTLSNPSNLILADSEGIGTILDDDQPALSLSFADDAINEAGGTTVATVTRNSDTSQPLTVDLTSSDTSEAIVPTNVTMAAGSSTATFTVTGVDDPDLDGTVEVTITASAAGHAMAEAIIRVFDDEQPDNLVYSFTLRGSRYGNGLQPVAGVGYMVLDLKTGDASAIIRRPDGNGERIDFPTTYIADLGASKLWVLATTAIEPETLAATAFSHGHMIGTEHPSAVPIGSNEPMHVVVSFAGPWRAGEADGTPPSADLGEMSARLDYRRSIQENAIQTSFESLLAKLAAEGGIDLGVAPRETTAAEAKASFAGEGIACYNLRWSGANGGEGAVESFSYVGFLLLDLATGEVRVLRAWRDGTTLVYTIDEWETAEQVAYLLTQGSSDYAIIGGREAVTGGHLFRFLYGAVRRVDIGLPSQAPQALPVSLSGNIWGHIDDAGDDGLYTTSTISCTIDLLTLAMNQDQMDLDAAVLHLESLLTGFERR